MKKAYEQPIISIENLKLEDVIATSVGIGDDHRAGDVNIFDPFGDIWSNN